MLTHHSNSIHICPLVANVSDHFQDFVLWLLGSAAFCPKRPYSNSGLLSKLVYATHESIDSPLKRGGCDNSNSKPIGSNVPPPG